MEIEGVEGLHHVHIWSMDGESHILTAHVRLKESYRADLQEQVKILLKEKLLKEFQISEATLEFEWPTETCRDPAHR